MPTTQQLAALPAGVTYDADSGKFYRTSVHHALFSGSTDLHVMQGSVEACLEYARTSVTHCGVQGIEPGTPIAALPDVHVRSYEYRVEASRSDALLWRSSIEPEMWTEIRLAANRMMNTVGGRPSDCMASTISSYEYSPDMFREARDRDREHDQRVREIEREHIRSGRINLDTVGR